MIGVFLGIAFAFAWGYVVLYEAFGAAVFAGTTAGRIIPYFAAWGPLLAVSVVLWRADVDLREWFDRQVTLQNPLRVYLGALLLPNVVSSAAMGVFPTQGIVIAVSMSPVNFVLVFGFTFFLLGALEEFGWRGFLQPILQYHTNALAAALLVGLVWGLWHVPSHLLGQLGDRPLWLFVLHLIPMSVVMAWIYNRTAGVLPVMVFHAAHNAPGNLFSVASEVPSDLVTVYYAVYTGLWLVIGGVIVAYAGPSLGTDESSISEPTNSVLSFGDIR